jgi:hypothetical protein
MCQTHRRDVQAAFERERYEGETVRLDAAHVGARPGHRGGAWWWWAPWMIWPALLLIKSLVPAASGAATLLLGWWALLAGPAQAATAVALIVLGAALLWRGRASTEQEGER